MRLTGPNHNLQTRTTTKYTIPNLSSPHYAKKRARNLAARDRKAASSPSSTPAQADLAQPATTTAAEPPKQPRAYIELKTYDPESGVALKYKTDKAAEVGRLIASLGRLGRHMAALPEIAEGECCLSLPDYVEWVKVALEELPFADD